MSLVIVNNSDYLNHRLPELASIRNKKY